ncbi:hypothetical protein ACP70R_002501 [Stipagrostis hirtigluma subsp. patula]
MLMDGAGLVEACLAVVIAAVVFRRYGDRSPGARGASRATHVAVAVAVLVHAGVLLSAGSDGRNLASRLMEAETKLQRMEEFVHEMDNHEIISNLADILSKNPGNIKSMSYKVEYPYGSANADLTVKIKYGEVDQPPADDPHHADEVKVSMHA